MTIKRNLQRNNAPSASVQSVSSGLEMGMSLRVILPAGRSGLAGLINDPPRSQFVASTK